MMGSPPRVNLLRRVGEVLLEQSMSREATLDLPMQV